jgi:uncharacterized membrane protein YfcA
MMTEAAIAGVVAGIVGALLGLGGGIVMVPALVLLFGLPMGEAVPASLVGVVATALGGTAKYLRASHTDSTLAIRAGLVTIAGAIVAARVAVYLPDRVLQITFGVVLLVITWHLAFGKKGDEPSEGAMPMSKAVGLFVGAGFASGLLGVGGGILNVPAIRLAMKRTMLTAIATSTMMIAFTAGAGAATYASADMIRWPLATGCALGTFAGGRIGATLAPRLKNRALQWVFTIVLFYVAVEMAVRGLGIPWWR